MTGMGMALLGTDVAKGESRAIEPAQRAISSPLLGETSTEGAKGVLLNISGGRDLTLHEVNEAARIIAEAVDPDANIISGMVIDPEMVDEMKVTVIATGFDRARKAMARAGEARPAEPRPPASRPVEVRPAAEARAADSRPAPPPRREPEPAQTLEEAEDATAEVPFFRRAMAHASRAGAGDDPGGYGPNWSNVDDYDIPTVLRKQMD